jgi:hypothetical protein
MYLFGEEAEPDHGVSRMRPGASRLSFAAACLGLIAASSEIQAAPRGAGLGFAGSAFSVGAGRHGRAGAVRPGGLTGYDQLSAGRFRYGHGNRFGYGNRLGYGGRYGYGYGDRFGHGYGFGGPFGYGFGGGYAWGGGTSVVEAAPPRPAWPTTIGIPASPVQPPAIYVIGGTPRSAASSRRTERAGNATVASGPRIITLPSGR